jgi:cysteinyl-tRNA synthetase
MSAKYLGDTFDIHAGGEDLIFPHHENEIAQSEGASGRPFARYWLHNGFVTVGGEKMAKSLGNFVTIRDALRRFPADALKLLLVSTNYRGPLDYTETAVAEKGKALQGFQEFLRAVEFLRAETGRAGGAAASAPTAHPAEESFRVAMDDDFNTARATGVLFDLVREGNRMLQEVRGAGEPSPSAVAALEETAALLTRLGSVLALDFAGATADVSAASAVTLTRSADEAVGELTRLLAVPPPYPAERSTELTGVVRELLALREAARKQRAWAEADGIRRALVAAGIRVDDTRQACHATSEFPADRGLPAVAVSVTKE